MIEKVLKQLRNKLKGKIICLTSSDLVLRGVYIPNEENATDEINEELIVFDGIDKRYYSDNYYNLYHNGNFVPDRYLINKKKVKVKLFSLRKFSELCRKADSNALAILTSLNKAFV